MNGIVVKRSILLIFLLFSASCQSDKSIQSKLEPVRIPGFDTEEVIEEAVYKEAAITADQIVNEAPHTWKDKLFEANANNFTLPPSMPNDSYKMTGYLLHTLGIDVICSDDVPPHACSSSIDNLVEATILEDFPSNPKIAPIGYIEITNQTSFDDRGPYLDYTLGLNGKLFVNTGPFVTVSDWGNLITEVLSSSYRSEIVNDWTDGISDEVLALEELFNARIIKKGGLGEDKFQIALQKLEQVLRTDEGLRTSRKYSPVDFSKDQSLGNKAFQSIVIGNRNRDTGSDSMNKILKVEIDWEASFEEIYFHLLKQPNLSNLNNFTPFQIKYFQSIDKLNESIENYQDLLAQSLSTLQVQQEISESYLDIPRLTGISSIRCDMTLHTCRDTLLYIVESVGAFVDTDEMRSDWLGECEPRLIVCQFSTILSEEADNLQDLNLAIKLIGNMHNRMDSIHSGSIYRQTLHIVNRKGELGNNPSQ